MLICKLNYYYIVNSKIVLFEIFNFVIRAEKENVTIWRGRHAVVMLSII